MTKTDAPIEGTWTALATPFRADGEIDWDSYDGLLRRQEKAGVTGLVICGTTGEAPTLTAQEKLSLIRKARAQLSSSVRIMAGAGSSNTNQSVEFAKLAADAGADSLLVATPPYNKPSTDGLVGHFKAVAEAVDVPLCLYHVPGRTGQHLSVDQMETLCGLDGVEAVKEASGDLAFFSRSVLRTTVPFLSGEDPTYLPSLSVGGRGVISVVSNIFPSETVALTKAYEKGETKRALRIHSQLFPVIEALFCEPNPGPLKAALAHWGWSEGHLRLPLAPVRDGSDALIRETIDHVREQFDSEPA